MQRNLEIFLRVRGKDMTKSVTGVLNIAVQLYKLVTAIGTQLLDQGSRDASGYLAFSPRKPEKWGSAVLGSSVSGQADTAWQRKGRAKPEIK